MIKHLRKTTIFFLSAIFVLSYFYNVTQALAVDNSLVITNENLRAYNLMSANDINEFLKSHGSWLADYVIPEYISVQYPTTEGERYTDARQNNDVAPAGHNQLYGKTVAQLIFEECNEHQVNPRLILSALEKESSSVSRTSADMETYTNSRSWPLFYNYDDSMLTCFSGHTDLCNDAKYDEPTYEWRARNYGGIGQQVAYATAWYNMSYTCFENPSTCISTSASTRSWYLSHPWNETITISNQTFNCASIATRVLYVYTPGLQTNFYNIYANWFGDPAVNNGIAPPPPPPQRKAGDANNDSAVDSTDLSILADQWSKNVAASTGADYNNDGLVDSTDLSILADAWGK